MLMRIILFCYSTKYFEIEFEWTSLGTMLPRIVMITTEVSSTLNSTVSDLAQ